MSTKKQLPIACLFLLLLANICSTFLLAALSVRGYISLVKFFKSISMALVIAAVGLMAHTLLPELVFTVSLIVLAFIHYILVPGSMICIGRWKWDSQDSKTDKESVESLWKYALMILVLSSTAILATNNMQQRPTMVCFLLVLSFLFGTSTLVLLSIRERVCTIRIRSLVLLVSAYSFASGVLMVMASGILVYSLTPKHMFILLVVIAFVITVLVPLTLIWIWRPAGDDLQSETDEDAVESGWNISLMIPIVSLIGVIGMFVPQPQPPKTCFYLLFIAFISSTVLKLVLMIRGQARSGQTRAFVLRVYYYNLISFMFVLSTLVYVAVNYLVKYVQAGGFP
ncbi:hypothetical protein QJS04_geneDACA013330 [Acorus gramineus]|uniref:NADH dehydrogenase subunit 2 n=1 Tax=Acorus gramineus TaxID=55184 RepID=A0AAV9AAJ5_ACOGR|nr:hypothetical protein QJS04_geneDACA013330 [Acorus gramineus]